MARFFIYGWQGERGRIIKEGGNIWHYLPIIYPL